MHSIRKKCVGPIYSIVVFDLRVKNETDDDEEDGRRGTTGARYVRIVFRCD